MYHYTDRYSQTGTFRQFCEARGVSKNQISRWRPTIMQYLREELAAYAPVPEPAHQRNELTVAVDAPTPVQKPAPHINTALQYSLFSDELVDNRTSTQRKRDKKRHQPRQVEMFRAADIAQFGVNPHPLFSLSPNMLLPMMSEDPRTEEEIEADRWKAALELTLPMFANEETSATNTSQAEETSIFERVSYKEQVAENPKLAAYLKVVQEAKEVLLRGTVNGIIFPGIVVNLMLAVLAANEAGVTQAEIKAAVQIGSSRTAVNCD